MSTVMQRIARRVATTPVIVDVSNFVIGTKHPAMRWWVIIPGRRRVTVTGRLGVNDAKALLNRDREGTAVQLAASVDADCRELTRDDCAAVASMVFAEQRDVLPRLLVKVGHAMTTFAFATLAGR